MAGLQWTGAAESEGVSSPFDASRIFAAQAQGGARGRGGLLGAGQRGAALNPPLSSFGGGAGQATGIQSLGTAPLPGAWSTGVRPPPLSTQELEDQHSALAAARRARLHEGRPSNDPYSMPPARAGAYVSPTRITNRPF